MIRFVFQLALLAAMVTSPCHGEILTGTHTYEVDHGFHITRRSGPNFELYGAWNEVSASMPVTITSSWDTETNIITVDPIELNYPELSITLRDAWTVATRTLIRVGEPAYCDFNGCYPAIDPEYGTSFEFIDSEFEAMVAKQTIEFPAREYRVHGIGEDTLLVAPIEGGPPRFDLTDVPFPGLEWDERNFAGREFAESGEHPQFMRFYGAGDLDRRVAIERDDTGKVTGLMPRLNRHGQLLSRPDRFGTGQSVIIVPEPGSYLMVGLVFGLVMFSRAASQRWRRPACDRTSAS